MLKLLIVDDEAITRNGLRRHIDWRSMGVDVVQLAENADDALNVCRDLRPDIVLSDIRMRGMNGIEMCRRIKKSHSGCKIIFISGYSDKEYLKSAIELGAVYYIEKPIDPDEVRTAVERAIHSLQEDRAREIPLSPSGEQFFRSQLLFSLIDGTVSYDELDQSAREEIIKPGGESQSARIGILRLNRLSPNIGATLEKLNRLLGGFLAQGSFSLHHDYKDERNIVALLYGQEGAESALGQALEGLASFEDDCIRLFAALGAAVEHPRQLKDSYAQARRALDALFTKGYGAFVSADDKREGRRLRFQKFRRMQDEFEDATDRAVAAMDKEDLLRAFDALCRELRTHDAAPNLYIRNLFYSFDQKLFIELSLRNKAMFGAASAEAEYDGRELDGLDALEQFEAYFHGRMGELEADGSSSPGSSLVTRLIRIIQENYTDHELSVNSLAERVHLTPTYICAIFKQNTGKTIGEHISQVRIKNSKALLADDRHKLYHVAKLVGYRDANYYARVFKKHTGLTPSEYRAKMLR